MEITVIVPTRNRAKSLDVFLKSVKKQTIDETRYEIIVVDNGSQDNTKAICDKWSKIIKNYRYIYNDNPGLHVGRNIGYQESNSELLVYADDDIIAFPTWLESIVGAFENEQIVLVGGNDIPKYEGTTPEWLEELWLEQNETKILLDFSCILMGDKKKEISPYYVFGCNFAVRKWILDETRGFHPDGMPDNLLHYRGDGETYIAQYILENQLTTYFVPEASVYHMVTQQRMCLDYIKKIAYRDGISHAYTQLRSGRYKQLEREILKRKMRFLFLGKRWNNIIALKEEAHIKGMKFLANEYHKRESIKEWVMRMDYLGDNAIVSEGGKNNESTISKYL